VTQGVENVKTNGNGQVILVPLFFAFFHFVPFGIKFRKISATRRKFPPPHGNTA